MAGIRIALSVRLLVAATCLVGGTATAAPPAYAGASALRPWRHHDRYGRTLQDLCPERAPHQRRCFAQRVVVVDVAQVRPDAPFPGFGDPSCQPLGGGGGRTPYPGSMTPKDVLAAYQIPPSTAANGKIVALIELPSVHGMDDVNAYRKQFGIPALPACPVDGSGVPTPNGTACFARVGEDGTTNSVTTTDCAGWSGETGLDMDMVSAACPDCSIVLVEASDTTDLDKMNHVAATVVGAAAASNSWGGPETGADDPSPYDNANMLVFAASGDSGYDNEQEGYGAGTSYPASVPSVVAVGGTTLQLTGGSYSEVAWNDSSGQNGLFGGGVGAGGSGCSTEFPRPAWQALPGFTFGSCSKRASVDMAAAAQFDPTTMGGGIAAYDIDDDGWNSVEGTSAASPLTAAIMVRLGLAGKDNHALFYDHIEDFNDVTSGSNDNDGLCSDVMCIAGKGWDGPTGLGTPNGERLALLVGPLPPSLDASAPPVEASLSDAASAMASMDAATSSGPQDAASADLEGGAGDDACPSCSSGSGISNEFLPAGSRPGCSCRSAPASGSDAGGASAIALGFIALAIRRRRAAAADAVTKSPR
ncbi:MAG TPA: MYXO-CTERM sorting domain-containing protein [Polyangiaceae bacterium]|nr:MYXO-CTERM sorting domain-containing protein [Polyangiaceae bacterium]